MLASTRMRLALLAILLMFSVLVGVFMREKREPAPSTISADPSQALSAPTQIAELPSTALPIVTRASDPEDQSAALGAVEFRVRQGGSPVSGAELLLVDDDRFAIDGEPRKTLGFTVEGSLRANLGSLESWEFVLARWNGAFSYVRTPQESGLCEIDIATGCRLQISVCDSSGKPLSGCRILLSTEQLPLSNAYLDDSKIWDPLPGNGARKLYGGSTNEQGLLVMNGLEPASYFLDASIVGFLPFSGCSGELLQVLNDVDHAIVMAPLLAAAVEFEGDEILDYRVIAPTALAAAGTTLPIVRSAKRLLAARFPGAILAVGSTTVGGDITIATIRICARTSGWSSHSVNLRPIAQISAPTRLHLERGTVSADAEVHLSLQDANAYEISDSPLYLCKKEESPGSGDSIRILPGKPKLVPSGEWTVRSADPLLRSQLNIAVHLNPGVNAIPISLAGPWRRIRIDAVYLDYPLMFGEVYLHTGSGRRTAFLGRSASAIWVPCGALDVSWFDRTGTENRISLTILPGKDVLPIQVALSNP